MVKYKMHFLGQIVIEPGIIKEFFIYV